MTGPWSASPLASSGADWTGADIGDLHDLAATLHGYLPGLGDQAADPADGDAGHLWDSVL
jgi:hypothetical protein